MRRELREPSKFFSAWTLNPFSNACLGNLSRRTVEIPQQSLQNSACIANQYVDTIFPLKDRCTVAFSILWNQKVCQWTWSNRELEAVRFTLCLRSLLFVAVWELFSASAFLRSLPHSAHSKRYSVSSPASFAGTQPSTASTMVRSVYCERNGQPTTTT